MLVMITHQTNAKEIKLISLLNNPGIFPFKLGPARIKIGTHTLLYFIQLKQIINKVITLNDHYEIIKNHIEINKLNSHYQFSLQTMQSHIEFQLYTLKEKYESVFPLNRRTKRGLINALGGVVKLILGNLDQKDAKRYDEAIEVLKNNQSRIIKYLNQEITLSHEILNNCNLSFSLIAHKRNN